MDSPRTALRRVYRVAQRAVAVPARAGHAIRHRTLPAGPGRHDLFNLDLHIGPVADAAAAMQDRGISLTSWTLSTQSWVIGRRRSPVSVINEHTWRRFDPSMVRRFRRSYGGYLDGFRGYVASYPPCFSMLYEGSPGPTLVVCGTRYEHPFTHDEDRWRWLDDGLRRGVGAGRLTLVANNLADRDYVALNTGLRTTYLPSACTYTGAAYTGERDVVLVTALHDRFARDIAARLTCRAASPHEALGPRYSWRQLYDCRAVVLIPYNVSTMTLSELYTAGVPIYAPDRSFLKKLAADHPRDVLCQLSFSQVNGRPAARAPKEHLDLNDVADPQVLDWYLERADFYNGEWMPEIRQFGSWDHLDHLLSTEDQREIGDRMAAARADRLARISGLWDELGWHERLLPARG